MLSVLMKKLKDAVVSVLPVSAIVFLLNLTPLVDFSGFELLVFLIATVMLILGIALFNLGADLAAMAGAARLLRFDLFTCGVASLANIGGVASATIIAATYSPVLIPVGVLMAMLGFITGTGVGMLVGRILSLL